MIVRAIVDDALSPDFPLGIELEVFIRREDAERFIEEVCGDDPELASNLTAADTTPLVSGMATGSFARCCSSGWSDSSLCLEPTGRRISVH
jgi:hypothetical protein